MPTLPDLEVMEEMSNSLTTAPRTLSMQCFRDTLLVVGVVTRNEDCVSSLANFS